VFITENHVKRTGDTGSESSGILPRDKAEASCHGKIGCGWSQRNIRENRAVSCQHNILGDILREKERKKGV